MVQKVAELRCLRRIWSLRVALGYLELSGDSGQVDEGAVNSQALNSYGNAPNFVEPGSTLLRSFVMSGSAAVRFHNGSRTMPASSAVPAKIRNKRSHPDRSLPKTTTYRETSAPRCPMPSMRPLAVAAALVSPTSCAAAPE